MAAMEVVVAARVVAMGAALLVVVVGGGGGGALLTELNSSLFLRIAFSRPPLYFTSA